MVKISSKGLRYPVRVILFDRMGAYARIVAVHFGDKDQHGRIQVDDSYGVNPVTIIYT